MRYLVELSDEVKRFIAKLDSSIVIRLAKKLKELEKRPSSIGKPIGRNYRELKILKFRIYYRVTMGEIVVDKILYDGRILVPKAGDKKTQKKDINSLP